MFNVFRVAFASKSVLGLEVDDHFIGAVQVSGGGTSLEVERIAYLEVGDSGSAMEELGAFMRRENLDPDILVTAIPTSRSTIRELKLSFESPKKLGKIIKYQMEPCLPFPIEEVAVDFLGPDRGGTVTAVGVEKRVLSDHLKTLAGAGLEPDMVSLQDLALFHLFVASRKGDGTQTASVIRLGREDWAVQVIRGNRLDFIRVLQGRDHDVEKIRESFRLYTLREPRGTPERIFLTGSRGADDEMSRAVASLLKVETSVWRPFDDLKHGRDDVETGIQARLSVPLGLAVGALHAGSGMVNFRVEEFAVKTAAAVRPLMVFMLAALFVLLGLFTLNLYQRLSLEEKYYEELNKDVTKVFLGTFPGRRSIVKGQESTQMKQIMSEERKQYGWLEELRGQGTVLDVLLTLTRAIASYSEVTVDNVSIEGGTVHLDGRTSSFKMVDSLKGRLTKLPFFRSATLVSAKMDNKENRVRFNFVLERNR